jgi:DNA repair protein RecO (recombination protein O)
VAAEKTLAIVLRVIDFSESSCVVTLFTRDFGKITGLAKGARRPKGPFESALDLLSVVRIMVIRKSSDALDLLTEAKLEQRFRAAGRDLSRLYAAYYVAELLIDLTHDDDPHPELFEAALGALGALDGDGHLPTTLLRFELAALKILGHRPSLDLCASCGEPVPDLSRVPFGLITGGVLCANCREGKRLVVSLSQHARRTLERELAGTEAPREIEREVRGEIRGLLNQYVSHLLGHRPKMHGFFGMLASS